MHFLATNKIWAVGVIVTFTTPTYNDFLAIGGNSLTITSFPNGVQNNPYLRMGPSPDNTFKMTSMAKGGITNRNNTITTTVSNTPLTLYFTGNNTLKFGANILACDISGTPVTGNISVKVTTNLGNVATIVANNSSPFVGFNLSDGSEYITNIVATPASNTYTSIGNIIFGENIAQSVALNLDGFDDFVQLPNTIGNFAFNQDFTITTWVKIPSANQPNVDYTDNDILEKWDFSSAAYPFVIRYLNQTDGLDNRGKIKVARYDGNNNPSIISSITLNDDRWHHIAFVKNGSNLTLYIDGISSGTTTDNTSGTTTNTSPLYIGRRGGTFTNYFNGSIDEVRIWSVAKTAAEVANERFCKTPDSNNLQAAYNFNSGVPHGTNTLISQINNTTGSNHGILNGFSKTGDVSNFVTGQVKYVKKNALGNNNGSSWTNAYTNLQSALGTAQCNDLVEVWVAAGTYKPHVSATSVSFEIPSGIKVYGGFAGTELSINQKNYSLIHTTNTTILSGDLLNNDLPNFGNRSDNSALVVKFSNANNTTLLDGFVVSGGYAGPIGSFLTSAGILVNSSSPTINNCRIKDNLADYGAGISILGNGNLVLSNSIISGNKGYSGSAMQNGGNNVTQYPVIKNCIFSGNDHTVRSVIENLAVSASTIMNPTFINCSMDRNLGADIYNDAFNVGTVHLRIVNCLIAGGITDSNGSSSDISYSLVTGVPATNGNLSGVNSNYISYPGNPPSTDGDFHLKWCSALIDAGILSSNLTPRFDLDGNPRNINGVPDLGAYEYFGNKATSSPNNSLAAPIDVSTYFGTAIQTLSSTSKIFAPAGAIDFKASKSITLNPGFEVSGVTQYFKALIGPNDYCGY